MPHLLGLNTENPQKPWARSRAGLLLPSWPIPKLQLHTLVLLLAPALLLSSSLDLEPTGAAGGTRLPYPIPCPFLTQAHRLLPSCSPAS